MELFLLISLTIAPTIFAMTLPVNAASTTIAEVNGQLNICHTPVPCFTATLQANASGPDPEELTGMLLVYRAPGMAAAPRQPCVASVTGEVTSPMDAPTARLTGTLDPAQPAAACAGGCVCAGGLQGLSVTLFVDAVFGTMQLTTVTAAGYTEPLGSGSGTLTITQLGQST